MHCPAGNKQCCLLPSKAQASIHLQSLATLLPKNSLA